MTVAASIALAEELERYLGDPHDGDSLMPFAAALHHDERGEFPCGLLGALQRWGLHEYWLPQEWGGRAGDIELAFTLLRLAARRDPTAATALMLTALAFLPAWIAGTAEQRLALAKAIKNGTPMAWAFSGWDGGPPASGLADEIRAERVPGGYLLTGEKWLIGNATVAKVITVPARTDGGGGQGSWSIFAVDRGQCPAGSVVELPGDRLSGLRGLDLSGVRLDGVFVPGSARLGAEGQGLEIALKTAQTARAAATSVALGAADTALRLAMDFVTDHVIFGRSVAELPYSRRQLAECFADLMLADAVATGCVRALQTNPGQASVFSSTVRYLVPVLLQRSAGLLSAVLGARAHLRAHPHYGACQKMLRDLQMVLLADGGAVANLKNVALQLDGLLDGLLDAALWDGPLPGDGGPRGEAASRVRATYDLDAKLGEYRPELQQLSSRGLDDTVISLPDSVAALHAMADGRAEARNGGQQREWLHRAADAADAIACQLHRLRTELDELQFVAGPECGASAELFRLAEQYCVVHAAAAAAHLAVHSADVLGEHFPDGAVLLMIMERAWCTFQPTEPVTDVAVVDRVMAVLQRLHRERRLFSHWEFQLLASGEPR